MRKLGGEVHFNPTTKDEVKVGVYGLGDFGSKGRKSAENGIATDFSLDTICSVNFQHIQPKHGPIPSLLPVEIRK